MISSPLQALSKKNSSVGSVSLQTLKDILGAKHPQFRGSQENDAQEFLRLLISDLHEEMRPLDKSMPKYVSTTGLR